MQIKLTEKDFGEYLKQHALQESTKVKSAGHWIGEVLLDESGVKGSSLPWEATHGDIGLDAGCLTIWGGWSGHGKSELLGQVMLWLMNKHRVAIASLEMRPAETINRMIRQTHGAQSPSDEYKMGWMDWANDRLFIYDAVDRVRPVSMMGMALYCYKELGIEHMVIDSLTKCGISKDDVAGQATFVDNLQNIAKNTGIHIHLVTHLRKSDGSKSNPEPSKDDVRGAGEITDLADTVFMVYRNKMKDGLIADGKKTFLAKDGTTIQVDDLWDTKLKLVKNRHTGVEMDYKLHRHPSGQYSSAKGRRMTHPDAKQIDKYTQRHLKNEPKGQAQLGDTGHGDPS